MFNISEYELSCRGRKRDDPFTISLSSHSEITLLKIDLMKRQTHKLRNTNSSCIEQVNHRAVSRAKRISCGRQGLKIGQTLCRGIQECCDPVVIQKLGETFFGAGRSQ